jgi:hypothetical protein
MTIERNKTSIADEPISTIDNMIKLKSKSEKIQFLRIKIITLRIAMPKDTRSIVAFTNNLAYSKFRSEKLFPRKRGTPLGMPIVTNIEKIAARETTVEAIPITPDVVILDRASHKTYPEDSATMFSI